MVNRGLFSAFMDECAFARLIFATESSQHVLHLRLPTNKELRRAHGDFHLAHEYASRLPCKLTFDFIRCVLIYLLALRFLFGSGRNFTEASSCLQCGREKAAKAANQEEDTRAPGSAPEARLQGCSL